MLSKIFCNLRHKLIICKPSQKVLAIPYVLPGQTLEDPTPCLTPVLEPEIPEISLSNFLLKTFTYTSNIQAAVQEITVRIKKSRMSLWYQTTSDHIVTFRYQTQSPIFIEFDQY